MQRNIRRHLYVMLALIAAGCSGGSGGCGSSCGGAFKTTNADGSPFTYHGDRLANVAQVRVTKSGFNFLNAQHLNEVLGALNAGAAGGFAIPCTNFGELFKQDILVGCFKFSATMGDNNFNNSCADGTDGAKLFVDFKNVTWQLDQASNTLKAHVLAHIKTSSIYLHTNEAHSSSFFCGSTEPIQARLFVDDENAGLPQKDTQIDLDLKFNTTPDGRLEIDVPDSSLNNILTNFQPGMIFFDGKSGADIPAPVTHTGAVMGDGCDNPGTTYNYTPADGSGNLACSGVFNWVNTNCDFSDNNQQGWCSVMQYVRGYLFDYIKNTLKTQIVGTIRKQLDAQRCQRAKNSQGQPVDCTADAQCGNDDDGNALKCDAARGVCYPASNPAGSKSCEPLALAVAGQVDVSSLTEKIGFPPGTKLDLYAGLGSKGGGAKVDNNGLQLSAMAGTAPSSNFISLCVPPAFPLAAVQPPALDFDSVDNKPVGLGDYSVSFSLASAMLNRGFYDAYNAGLLCVAVTNKTTSFISSGLFKTFLPSLNLLTGGQDRPMMILLRPSAPPFVRIGRNTYTANNDGSVTLTDPLITLDFRGMNLDFYALVDERQVRIFTLQADLKLPLSLRTFADPDSDKLQPVLGSLDTLLTNIKAVSADGGAYDNRKDILSDDPGVVKDLLGAAVRLAQPLLAGVIKPIALPSMLNLKFSVKGVAGAVPQTDLANDGYHHLAVWAGINECSGTCAQYTVDTEARVANRIVPDSVNEIRAGVYPSIELDVSAKMARSGTAEFSYRVDGSMWGPWMSGPRLTIRDPLFLAQGHHVIEVTSREAGDDHTMDMEPVAVDFFVSYEPPKAELYQRPDGAVVTRAHSGASRDAALLYSYRVEGQGGWTTPGPARVFTQAELGGAGLMVSVSDEAGRSTQARFGIEEGAELARAGMAGGCATSAGNTAWSLLPLLLGALLLRRRRSA